MITSPTSVPLSLALALTSQTALQPYNPLRRLIHTIDRYMRHLRLPLIIIGTVWTVSLLFITPTLIVYITATLYIFIWILEIITHYLPHPLGTVVDSATTHPLDRAIVRIIKHEGSHQALIGTHVTHTDGVYLFLVSPGTYSLSVIRPGYAPTRTASEIYTKPSHTKETVMLHQDGEQNTKERESASNTYIQNSEPV